MPPSGLAMAVDTYSSSWQPQRYEDDIITRGAWSSESLPGGDPQGPSAAPDFGPRGLESVLMRTLRIVVFQIAASGPNRSTWPESPVNQETRLANNHC